MLDDIAATGLSALEPALDEDRTPRLTFQEIDGASRSERVAAALINAFFSGKLAPGDRIVEREISRQMKVGTPTVREALLSLQALGYVRRMKNTSTYVTKFDAQEIRQIFAFRTELEGLALSWARSRVVAADLRELRAIVDLMVAAAARKSRREFAEQDDKFHRRLWALTGNPFLIEALEKLVAPLFAFSAVADGRHLTVELGQKHYEFVDALHDLDEPEFSVAVRNTLKWLESRNPFHT